MGKGMALLQFANSCLVCLLLFACSDGNDTDGNVMLDDAQKLSSLSDAELGALCDWSNAQQGGYGKDTNCADNRTVSTQKDQASCKAEDGPTLAKCEQTVAQYKTCTRKIASDPCLDLATVVLSPECKPMLSCFAGG